MMIKGKKKDRIWEGGGEEVVGGGKKKSHLPGEDCTPVFIKRIRVGIGGSREKKGGGINTGE